MTRRRPGPPCLDARRGERLEPAARRPSRRRRRRCAVAAGQRGSRHLGATSPASPRAQPPDLADDRHRSTNVDVEGIGEILRIEATPTHGQPHDRRGPRGLIRAEQLRRSALALCGAAHRLPARPGRADLRRRPRSRLDAGDPRHPAAPSTCRRPSSSIGENALGHPRPAQPDRRRGPRARQPQLHPSQFRDALRTARRGSS